MIVYAITTNALARMLPFLVGLIVLMSACRSDNKGLPADERNADSQVEHVNDVPIKRSITEIIRQEPLPPPTFCRHDQTSDDAMEVDLRRPLTWDPELARYLYCEGYIREFHATIEAIEKGDALHRFPGGTPEDSRDGVVLRILQPEKHKGRRLKINFADRIKLEDDSPWRKINGEVVFSLPEQAIGNRIVRNDRHVFLVIYDADLDGLQFLDILN